MGLNFGPGLGLGLVNNTNQYTTQHNRGILPSSNFAYMRKYLIGIAVTHLFTLFLRQAQAENKCKQMGRFLSWTFIFWHTCANLWSRIIEKEKSCPTWDKCCYQNGINEFSITEMWCDCSVFGHLTATTDFNYNCKTERVYPCVAGYVHRVTGTTEMYPISLDTATCHLPTLTDSDNCEPRTYSLDQSEKLLFVLCTLWSQNITLPCFKL